VSAIETTGAPAPAGWMRSYANSRWAALPVLVAGSFMIVADFFIVNVAFPSIQADLHASSGLADVGSALFLVSGSVQAESGHSGQAQDH
jgi:MFS family permease